jgi:hypothetical protein
MILDKLTMFDEATNITVTRNCTNPIDLLRAAQDIGEGEEIVIRVSVVRTFTAVGLATLQIVLVTDDEPALLSPVVLDDQGAVIPVASLVVGFEVLMTIAPSPIMKQWLGLLYLVANGPMTAGAIDAGIVESVQGWKAYPRNYATT